MKLLIDECLPRKLKKYFIEHQVSTVQEMGWSGKKDRELLQQASVEFDVFITIDQNLQYQQNLRGFAIAIVLLGAKSNKIADLEPLISRLHQALQTIQSGDLVEINRS